MEEMRDEECMGAMGMITIDKIKKMFRKRQFVKTYPVNSTNESVRIIESHSEPNLSSITINSTVFLSNPGSPALDSDDSFIEMKNLGSKLPRTSYNLELDNTLDVMDYILSHGPNKEEDPVEKHDIEEENKAEPIDSLPIKITSKKEQTSTKNTLKITGKTELKGSLGNHIPSKSVTKKLLAKYIAPSSSSIKSIRPILKTPASTLMKTSTRRNTPIRNAYQHIRSPVASYINCPQVPLVTNVYPKKSPSASSIAMSGRNPNQGTINKNLNLPSYESAKKSKMIGIIDGSKLPQSTSRVKRILSPNPIKRDIDSVKKQLFTFQDDSF